MNWLVPHAPEKRHHLSFVIGLRQAGSGASWRGRVLPDSLSGCRIRVMPAIVERHRKPARPLRTPPPLENGDRLSSREFLRRYEAMPELKKAELIQGVVYMPSPVSANHSNPMGSSRPGWAFTPRTHPVWNAIQTPRWCLARATLPNPMPAFVSSLVAEGRPD